MSTMLPAATNTGGVNGVALTVLIVLFVLVTVMGFMAARWRRRPTRWSQPRRVGPRRSPLRHLGHLVPARRRPLHRVHVRRRAGGDVRARVGQRLLRRAVHDRASTRSSSSSWPGCGRSATATATSPRPTSSRVATAPRACRWRCRSPASSRRCRTSPCSSSASRPSSRSSASAGSNALAKDLPLFIAFAVLAAYTYSSGLRAPAMIAFVKDALIYLVIIVAIIYLPLEGRWLGPRLRRGRRPRWPRRTP